MNDLDIYLQATEFIDSDSAEIMHYAEKMCMESKDTIEKAITLYYAVRDNFYYDPYRIDFRPKALQATSVLTKGYGFCISKAVLLAALARAENIPSRLGFADVRNHLTTERFRQLMQTDILVYHGYTELFLESKWVKATPAFNLSLCERFGVTPLEFDGKTDSIFHEFDRKGNRHMEYVRDRGQFADLPYDEMLRTVKKYHPALFSEQYTGHIGDFRQEALAEKRRKDS